MHMPRTRIEDWSSESNDDFRRAPADPDIVLEEQGDLARGWGPVVWIKTEKKLSPQIKELLRETRKLAE